MEPDLTDEATYELVRSRRQVSRRGLLQTSAGLGLGAAAAGLGAAPAAAAGTIVKPLPPELFVLQGTNAEMRWEAMRGQGYLTPIDRFFVRNHTATPEIDVRTWRLRLWGTGLRHSPAEESPIEFTYEQLRRLPAETLVASVECTGNGRSFYASQQGQTVSGTPWKLGAVGVAHWRGVRLSTLLRHAGLTRGAVDVLPRGLDADFVDKGVNLGRVRRPLPIAKALKDVLVAYEMRRARTNCSPGPPTRPASPSRPGRRSTPSATCSAPWSATRSR